jgi:hypothetical protein
MRPLRYSINVTLDGCCDHREIVPDEAAFERGYGVPEKLHRHAAENLAQVRSRRTRRGGPCDALLFGRVTYELMEAAFRPAWTGEMPDWMEPDCGLRTADCGFRKVVEHCARDSAG